MKSIWIISQNSGAPKIGGVQRHFFFSKIFHEKGWNPIVISAINNHLLIKPIKKGLQYIDGVKFYGIKTTFGFTRGNFRFLQMIGFGLRCFFLPFSKLDRPDIIILSSMSIFPLPAILFLKYFYRVKFIFEIRDLWPLTPIQMKKISKWNPMIIIISKLEKIAYRCADKIVTTLENSQSYINSIIDDSQKIKYIPNGVPESFIQIKPIKPTKKTSSNKIVFTYGGSFGIANALGPLINFLENQNELSNKIEFNLIGSGYLKKQYKSRISQMNNVCFEEKMEREAFIKKLKESDVAFISWMDLPELYKYGVSAQKYYDYMATGTPILSAQNGINDPVRQSGCGIIVKNEPEQIKKGVYQFLSMSKSEREKMGEKGREYVKAFSYERLSKKYIQLFDSL